MSSTAEWVTRPERSNLFWLRTMSWISLHLGRSASRLVLYPIAAYFLCFAHRARRASAHYLTRALGRKPGPLDLFRHFFAFAATIHDRFYLINDRFDLFDIELEHDDLNKLIRTERRGALLMGAHLGSFEVARSLARQFPDRRLSMLMYEENSRKINAALKAINPDAVSNTIALGRMDSMLIVRERLAEGMLVGVLSDRSLRRDATVTLDFLGAPARFPVAPWRMAAMLRQPVFFMSGIYCGGNHYRIQIEKLADFSLVDDAAKRQAAIDEAIRSYVARLEKHCREAPYNWFNFFDFWQTPESQSE